MRKIILGMLVLCLIGTLPYGSAKAMTDSEIIGTWYLNTLIINGISVHPSAMRAELTLTLSPDGTMNMQAAAREGNGTWIIDGGTLMLTEIKDGTAGPPMPANLTDGTLTTGDAAMTLIYGREKQPPEPNINSAILPAEDVAAFNGEWIAALVEQNGVQLPARLLMRETVLTITNGEVQLAVEGTEVANPVPRVGDILDGSLVILLQSESGERKEQVYSLLENGMLQLPEGEKGLLYFIRRETEQPLP